MSNTEVDNNIQKLKEIIKQKDNEIALLKNALANAVPKLTPEIEDIKDYFESIIAIMPGHVYWQDTNNIFLGCNDLQTKSAGLFSRKDIVGKTNFDMPWKDQAEELNALNKRVIESGKPHSAEETAIVRGEQKIFLSQKVPLKDNSGKVIGILGISFDITDRKKAEMALVEAKEKAELANKAKSNFLAMMSHELRTPLNSILGMTQLLQSHKLNYQQKDYVSVIHQSCIGLIDIISEILYFTKLEAGKIEVNEEPLDLLQLLEDTTNSLVYTAKKKKLELITLFEPDVPRRILGDTQKIRQTLINLINNAIKFTPKGNITVGLRCIKKSKNNAILEFSVADTGRGIPEEELENIFERFTQVDKADVTKGGVGLGLAITRQLIEAQGGEISVKSKMGEGTTFFFQIPFRIDIKTRYEEVEHWQEIRSRARVLFAENKSTVGLERHLNLNTSTVVHMQQVVATLTKAYEEKKPYHIVIFECGLETSIVLQLTNEIKSNPSLKEMLIIYLIESSNFPVKQQLKQLGCDGFLIKPAQPTEAMKLLTNKCQEKADVWPEFDFRPKFSGTKVLIIDDNFLNRRIAGTMLSEYDCEVDMAEDGKEALRKLENSHYNIVFVDISLPDITGIEIAKRYRASEVNKPDMPMIALTAHLKDDYEQDCKKAGMNDIMMKPLMRSELQKMLKKHLTPIIARS